MAVCPSFNFHLVGDDTSGNKVLLDHFASGKLIDVDGTLCNIQLSLYHNPNEVTVSPSTEPVDGYIFLYDVSDQVTFDRLNYWISQIDMFNNAMSIYDEPKVLLGNVPTSDQRVVELELVLEFAEFVGMKYFEAELCQNTVGAEKAILALVRRIFADRGIVSEQGRPNRTKTLFSRRRLNTSVGKRKVTRTRNRSETVRTSQPPHPTDGNKQTDSFNSDEFELLSKEIVQLNMTITMMSALNLSIDESQKQDATSNAPENVLARCAQVVADANVNLKAAYNKIRSLRTASNEMITTLKKHIESANEDNDILKAQNLELQNKLDIAAGQNETLHKELDEAMQTHHRSFNWIVDKEEVQLTNKALGVGGYGTVSVANFRGFQVAAKKLHGMILTSYNRGLFDREMTIASCVRHPNCVQFMGAVVEDEPIILMELMPTVLRDVLPRELNKLSDVQIPLICSDVARALTYLHAMRPKAVIHRDVSSANVLLEPIANDFWRAKISDYGSANFLTMLKTKAPGNAVYAAPEACSPDLQSPKMDVFSFGVLVVEVYLREFPDPISREQMVHQLELMYPKAARIATKCLMKEPVERLNMYKVLEEFICIST